MSSRPLIRMFVAAVASLTAMGIWVAPASSASASSDVSVSSWGVSGLRGKATGFAVTVAQTGDRATNVALTVKVPPILRVDRVPSGCTWSGDLITCHADYLWYEQTFAFGVTPLTVGTSTISATVTAAERDPRRENNSGSFRVEVGEPGVADLRVQVSTPPAALSATLIPYEIRVTNSGPNPAVVVLVHQVNAEGAVIQPSGAATTRGSCVSGTTFNRVYYEVLPDGARWTCYLGVIAVGDVAVVSIEPGVSGARIDAPGVVRSVSALGSSTTDDPTPNDSIATTAVPVYSTMPPPPPDPYLDQKIAAVLSLIDSLFDRLCGRLCF